MKQSIDNVEMLRLMEKKQKLLFKIRAALALDRMDLVKELSYEFQVVLEKEHNLKQFNFLKL
jgi:hypothetical protein